MIYAMNGASMKPLIKLMKRHSGIASLMKHSEGASGYDICLDTNCVETFLFPGQTKGFPTGIFLEMPEGIEAQIRPRSGLAFKSQVTVLNSPGTIDSDYRGEIYVMLVNHGPVMVTIKPGERIAQLVFCPVFTVDFEETKELSTTKRGQNGLGSTGE